MHFSKFFSGVHFSISDDDIDREISKIGVFVRSGLVVLSVILLSGIAIAYGKGQDSYVTTSDTQISNKKLPIYCVDRSEPKIALTFDAAWGNEDTATILSILEEAEIHVTFFMTGGWVEQYPDDVKAIYEAGHELGNHSESHKQMSLLSAAECAQEIQSVHEKVKELTGYEMKVFRPPYGDYNDTVVEAAESCGYYPIQWDVDSLDWKDYGVDSILTTVLDHKHLGNGSIILCHNGATYTPEALPNLIAGLKEKGYSFVTVSELIYKENYEMDVEGRQFFIQ